MHLPIKTPTPKDMYWSRESVSELLDLPIPELMFRAQLVHREHFNPCEVQLSTLLSIKSGGCPEKCGYCSQSAHHHAPVADEPMLDASAVKAAATAAKVAGATRFCMGAAWRQIRDRDLPAVTRLVETVGELGLESCLTAGMLKPHQATVLRAAGLDYYNHNLDTAPEIYGNFIPSHTFQDRLETLETVRAAGLKVCSGGILGMGESRAQRAALIAQLANLDPFPESVPINQLVRMEGTPLEGADILDPLEFVRVIAAVRITMPTTRVRLSAGRKALGDLGQGLCFLAGANSIFYGDKLLTTGNPAFEDDKTLFSRLGLVAAQK
jgi:biotin synthase